MVSFEHEDHLSSLFNILVEDREEKKTTLKKNVGYYLSAVEELLTKVEKQKSEKEKIIQQTQTDQIIDKATFILSQAISHDKQNDYKNAVDMYINAAEAFVEAKKGIATHLLRIRNFSPH